jgi:hypothetical protein
MVYTRTMSDAVIRLIKQLEAATAKHQKERLGSYVVLFCDSTTRAAELQALAKKEKLQHTLLALAVLDEARPAQGETARRLEKFHADTTIILATSKRVVKACFAYRKGELNDKEMDRILRALARILPKQK